MPIDHERVVKRINDNDNLLEVLIDVEDFLDSLDLYVFKNWIDGQVVQGPIIKRYFVELTLKYTVDKIPDPRGAKRLMIYDVEVTFKKSTELKPIKVVKPSDYEDGGHRPRLEHTKVWLVHLKIPRRYIENIIDLADDYEDEVSSEHLDAAADEGISDENVLQGGQMQPDMGMGGPPMGGAGPAPTPPPTPPQVNPMGG